MLPPLTGISSMATRAVLAELAQAYRTARGVEVAIESVGGVDAARRVEAGEAFDLVVLASDAIERLAAGGHLVAGSTVDVVRSEVVAAVRAATPVPDVHDEEALRRSVLAARRIGYSTGPSGTQLLKLFERWGLLGQLEGRLVQAAPGVPVGSMVAAGDVDLGFQQRSELMGVAGIEIVGPLPPPVQIVTVFSAAIAVASRRAPEVRAFLEFLAAPATAAAKARHGMAPA